MRGDYPPLRHLGATLYLILTKNINKLPSLWFFGQCQRTPRRRVEPPFTIVEYFYNYRKVFPLALA